MATDQTPTPAEGEAPLDGEDEKRRPYVVVLMSAEMKDALKAYATAHDTNPTQLGRVLFAQTIGYDLSGEPEPQRRTKYTSDDDREAAKKRASLKSGLLRKALFQVHQAQMKKRSLLLEVANRVVLATTDDKITLLELEALDAELVAQIKAGT